MEELYLRVLRESHKHSGIPDGSGLSARTPPSPVPGTKMGMAAAPPAARCGVCLDVEPTACEPGGHGPTHIETKRQARPWVGRAGHQVGIRDD